MFDGISNIQTCKMMSKFLIIITYSPQECYLFLITAWKKKINHTTPLESTKIKKVKSRSQLIRMVYTGVQSNLY